MKKISIVYLFDLFLIISFMRVENEKLKLFLAISILIRFFSVINDLFKEISEKPITKYESSDWLKFSIAIFIFSIAGAFFYYYY